MLYEQGINGKGQIRKDKRGAGIKERYKEDDTFERDLNDVINAIEKIEEEDKEICELNTDEDVHKQDIAKISSRIMIIKKGFIPAHENIEAKK